MGQRKGQTGNPNGRPKGSENKTSAIVRQALLGLLYDNIPRLTRIIEQGDDKEAGKLLVSLAKHLTFPEISPERLSEDQLRQVVEYLKKQNEQEQFKGGDKPFIDP